MEILCPILAEWLEKSKNGAFFPEWEEWRGCREVRFASKTFDFACSLVISLTHLQFSFAEGSQIDQVLWNGLYTTEIVIFLSAESLPPPYPFSPSILQSPPELEKVFYKMR